MVGEHKGKSRLDYLDDFTVHLGYTNRRAHRALYDCEVTGMCYLHFKEVNTK